MVQALGAQKIPAFLMEQRIAYNGKLGRLAEIPDRISFGRELVQAIYTVVVQVPTKRSP